MKVIFIKPKISLGQMQHVSNVKDKYTHIQLTSFYMVSEPSTRKIRIHNGEKISLSINGVEKTGQQLAND